MKTIISPFGVDLSTEFGADIHTKARLPIMTGEDIGGEIQVNGIDHALFLIAPHRNHLIQKTS